MGSVVHEYHVYKCPKAGCGQLFKVLSASVMHIESECCGFATFVDVQESAIWGIGNVVGRIVERAPVQMSIACGRGGVEVEDEDELFEDEVEEMDGVVMEDEEEEFRRARRARRRERFGCVN